MIRYYLLWQDEGLTPEIISEAGYATSEESESAAKKFVQSKAWTPDEDSIFELVVEDWKAWINAFSNGQIDEWYAAVHPEERP